MYPIDKVDLVLLSVKEVEIRIHRRWFLLTFIFLEKLDVMVEK